MIFGPQISDTRVHSSDKTNYLALATVTANSQLPVTTEKEDHKESESDVITEERDENINIDYSPLEELMAFTASSYIDDEEFKNVYLFLTTAQLSGDEKVDRKILLTYDNYIIENEHLCKLSAVRDKKKKRIDC